MKTSNLFSTYQMPGLLVGLIVLTTLISACSKNDSNFVIEGEARVMVVNAASGSEPQDFFIEDSKVNPEPLAYSQSTAYVTTSAGDSRKAEFKNSANATTNFTGYVNLAPNENYTFFYTVMADGTGNSSSVFQDDKASPSSGKAKIRFVNLAQGLPSANLLVIGGVSFGSNVAFGNSSGFSEVDPGTFNLQTVLASSTSTFVDLGSFTLEAGKIYTIYTSGSLTGSAQTAISAKMITHN